jgi:7-cyano-7-deazaguanine synthase
MKAVVLLSGGLDSTTLLALARSEKREVHALTFDYGQRHAREIEDARAQAESMEVADHRVIQVDLRAIGGSALTSNADVPKDHLGDEGIPVTYVPARNMIFLSIGTAFAESVSAAELWIGVNAVDFSGYPDCRPEFIAAFEKAIMAGTRSGVERGAPKLVTPLLNLTKADIIRLGARLGVDYSRTRSCYDPDETGRACGHCDSCLIRRRGFQEAGVDDPTPYSD